MKRAILLLALGVPTSLAAQNTVVSTYVAADDGVSGGPLLVGLNVVREKGWVAMRTGLAVDAGSTLFGSSKGPGTVSVISGDVDAMLYVGSPRMDRVAIPYVFGGVGARMLGGASTGVAATYGYGAGARMPLGGRVGLEGELRYREPLTRVSADAGQDAGLEYRFGLSYRFGNSLPRSRVVPPARLPGRIPTVVSSSPAIAASRRIVAERALDTADDFVGVRYTWGGNTPDEGFDCSGFIKYVYARHGISLPRVSADQAATGMALPLDVQSFEPGDLLAFASNGSDVDHIAIYAGNGRILHSSSSGNGVRFDDLYSSRGRWYLEHMVAARRVIDAGAFFAVN